MLGRWLFAVLRLNILHRPNDFRRQPAQIEATSTFFNTDALSSSKARTLGHPGRAGVADPTKRSHLLQVLVRDNNVDQALRALKKKMQREGVFREMKRRRFYEKPSERSAREKSEALRRARKLARKQLQREGLLPMPKKKEPVAGRGGAPRPPAYR
jgi:small subunit ribosomal protein S21